MNTKHNISLKLFVAILICFVVATVGLSIASVDTYAATSDSDTQALIDLNNQIAEIQKQLDSIASKQSSLNSKIKNAKAKQKASLEAKMLAEEKLLSLQEEQAYLEAYAASLEESIALLNNEIAITEVQYDEYYELYKSRIRANYENGVLTYLEIFLTSKSFSELLTRMDYAAYMIEYDKTLLKNLETALFSIKDSRYALEVKQDEAILAAAELEASMAEQEETLDMISAEISALVEDQDAYYDQLEYYKDLDAELEAQIAELKNKQIAYTGGIFIWPVPSINKISSPYGWRTLRGKKDFHRAIDIPAPIGTEVVASNAGTVIMARWVDTGGGLKIMIDHGGGINTVYNHNSKLLVKEGDVVKQGQVIALVGATGNVTGPHLDFSIIKNKEYLDPAKYVNYKNDPSKMESLF